MKKLKFALYQFLLAFAACFLVFTQPSAAISPITTAAVASDYLDFTANDIQTYEPRDSLTACGSTGGAVSGFNPDPAATKYFNDNYKAKYTRLIPLYQKAAAAENVADWQLIAAIHSLETSLSTTNPTTNPNYRGIFQQNADTLRDKGVDPSAPPFDSGRELSDDEIVTQAKSAIEMFIKGKATDKNVNVDVSKSLSVNDAMKIFIAYKSGQNSPWLTGGADPNLHAYAWAGYDTTPQHKMPMAYGSGGNASDEHLTLKIPGALTIWAMLKSGNVSSLTGADCTGATATFQGITGTREELAARVLANSKLKLGNYGSSATQKTDIQNALTANMLIVMVASLEQSGISSLPINSLKSDHDNDGGDHPAGRAADFGFYGNGDMCVSKGFGSQCGTADGNKLYNFLITNYQQLKINQLIWTLPPNNGKCVNKKQLVDCYASYGSAVLVDHYHHIHVGVSQ